MTLSRKEKLWKFPLVACETESERERGGKTATGRWTKRDPQTCEVTHDRVGLAAGRLEGFRGSIDKRVNRRQFRARTVILIPSQP